ncbi:MAG TPA: hypothetical protein VJ729_04565 [Nitrososphaeraceae archaeon]|nr:hypothetical protein [Nitrososphaeraceae archaeon]
MGAIVGALIFRWRKKVSLFMRYRGILIGVGAGIIIWFVFFVPTTILLIDPTLHRIASIPLSSESQKRISSDLDPFIRNVVISAIGFHLIWGAIVGFLSVKLYEIYNKGNRAVRTT